MSQPNINCLITYQRIELIRIYFVHFKKTLRESRFFQNCGTFNTNPNKKYHNFERNEIRGTGFLKWTDFTDHKNGIDFFMGLSGSDFAHHSRIRK